MKYILLTFLLIFSWNCTKLNFDAIEPSSNLLSENSEDTSDIISSVKVAFTAPAKEEEDVSENLESISVTFINPVDVSTLAGQVSLDPVTVALTYSTYDEESNTATYTVDGILDEDTEYTIVVSGDIKDLNGNTGEENKTNTFKTQCYTNCGDGGTGGNGDGGASGAGGATSFIVGSSPANGSKVVSQAVGNISIVLNVDIKGVNLMTKVSLSPSADFDSCNYDQGSREISCILKNNLLQGTDYNIVLTGLEETNGNILADDDSISFSTLHETTNLVGYYPLDYNGGETSLPNDKSGIGNDMISYTDLTEAIGFDIITGSAVSFNGTSSNLDGASLFSYYSDFTQSAWINIPEDAASYGEMMIIQTPSGSIAYDVMNEKFVLTSFPDGQGCNSGTGNYYSLDIPSPANSLLGNWKHIAFTYTSTSPTNATLYVDEDESSATMTAYSCSVDSTYNYTSIAVKKYKDMGNDKFNSYFKGSIDNVRIYNSALTPAQITLIQE